MLNRTITIECRFGSEYQRDVAMRMLGELLIAWKETAESAHKENHINITNERTDER
jgi:hypothetical protein